MLIILNLSDYLKKHNIKVPKEDFIIESSDLSEVVKLTFQCKPQYIIFEANDSVICMFEFIKLIQSISENTKVIIVCERISDSDTLNLYKLGVSEVFSSNPSVLEIKINAYLDEIKNYDEMYLEDVVHKVKVNTVTDVVVVNNEVVKLTKSETKLLKFFLKNANVILTREEIEKNLWGNNIVNYESRTIDIYVLKLRKKLGVSCISSVRGVGYMWSNNN